MPTSGFEAFGYKQLLFEPVFGGGQFSAVSLLLIAQLGPVPVLIRTAVITVGRITFVIRQLGPNRTQKA